MRITWVDGICNDEVLSSRYLGDILRGEKFETPQLILLQRKIEVGRNNYPGWGLLPNGPEYTRTTPTPKTEY